MISNSNLCIFFFSLNSVPVCPHGGGVGLCEYIQHISIFDYICVSASLENRLQNLFYKNNILPEMLMRNTCLLSIAFCW